MYVYVYVCVCGVCECVHVCVRVEETYRDAIQKQIVRKLTGKKLVDALQTLKCFTVHVKECMVG